MKTVWLPGERDYAYTALRSWQLGVSPARWNILGDTIVESTPMVRNSENFLPDHFFVGVIDVYTQKSGGVVIKPTPTKGTIIKSLGGCVPAFATDLCPILGISHEYEQVKKVESTDLDRYMITVEIYRRRDEVGIWIELFTLMFLRDLHALLESAELIMTLF